MLEARKELNIDYTKPNKSKSYIVPLFNKYVPVKCTELLINTFCFIQGFTEEDIFCLLYNIEQDTEDNFKEKFLINHYQQYSHLIKIDKFTNKLVFIFKIPENLVGQYHLFLNGKYSKLSKESKIIILNYLKNNYPSEIKMIMLIKDILYQNQVLRKKIETDLDLILSEDAELSSVIDRDRETFKC